MRYLLSLFIIFACCSRSVGQMASVSAEIVAGAALQSLFTDSVCKALNIRFPIFRVYKYTDLSGQYYCILTESSQTTDAKKDSVHQQIKAVNAKAAHGKLAVTWEINDHIVNNTHEEDNIWFWTKYTEFKDHDADGIADPIITYGTVGANGYDDGRIKIIVCFRGQKIAIRHQNGVLDFERETQVDKNFYSLPAPIQKAVSEKMELLTAHHLAIFPRGWQTAMKNKQTHFDERPK